MGGEIIAERFALIKTRGSNGLAFTHIVEDTLDGRRLVVKVSEEMGPLGLEYLKAANLLAEAGVKGVLLSVEGGFLDEGECYLAFPELGEPSLEHYLRMRPALTCEEALFVLEGVLHALAELHGAGFVHLFLEPRNVFYLPRRRVTLKDPALRPQFFHPFLEMVSAPDFSYLHPTLMDGGLPGAGTDVFAVGRLAERLRDVAYDAWGSPLAEVLEWLIGACTGEVVRDYGEGDGSGVVGMIGGERESLEDDKAAPTAGELLRELRRRHTREKERAATSREREASCAAGRGNRQRLRRNMLQRLGWKTGNHGAVARAKKKPLRPGFVVAAAWSLLFVLAMGLGAALAMRSWEGAAPAAVTSGASQAGGAEGCALLAEVSRRVRESEVGTACEGNSALDKVADGGAATELASEKSAAVSGTDGTVQGEVKAIGGGTGPDYPGGSGAPGNTGTAPVASFTLTPAEGESPLRVFLDASSSYDPDGFIVSYRWSCGGTGAALYHVFESNIIPAKVAVTLTVTDDAGNSASVTRVVTLY